MPDKEQEPLFSEVPSRENQPGKVTSWKDKALEEGRAELHQAPGDEFDRKDDQGRETAGQARLESKGMSRRQANNLLNVYAARGVLEASSRERAEAETAKRAEREQERDAEIIELLRDDPSDQPPSAA